MDEKTLFKLGYGLYVLSAQDEAGRDNGCIINTAVQVTSTPPAVAVTVNRGNLTHDIILDTQRFNLSVLTEKAPFSLVENFGFRSGRDGEKFTGEIAAERAENGLMYLSAYSNAYLSCKVKATVDLGTHTMFIADLVGGEVLSDDPTMSYAYYHANVKPKPAGAKKAGYRCKICGYVYEGETLPDDFICPICKHGAADFEKIEPEKKPEKGEADMEKFVCTICGYIYDEEKGDPEHGIAPGTEWDDIPEDWVCPVCGVGRELFEKAE